MSRRPGIWGALGIDRTDDVKSIRKAYADRLRDMDIDRDAARYAALRDARDTALRWAKSQSAGQEPAPDEWGLAETLEEGGGISPSGHIFEAGDQTAPPEQPAVLSEEEQAKLPDRRLDRLLFPNGELNEEPFTHEEAEQAREAMRELIADMLGGDLTRQRYGDYWLADRLASAWPRSAPLLADAAEAFEWEKERGQLGEGQAQAFLNARLRGMRFYEAAQQPDHWAYKPWKELATPGDKGLFGSFRTNKSDVEKLLRGIRENFPELESYFDPRKVATWEPTPSGPWKVSGGLVIALFVALRMLAVVGVESSDPYDPPVIETKGDAWTEKDRDEIVHELFGPETNFAELQLASPYLGELIRSRMPLDGYDNSKEITRRYLVDALRRMIFMARADASFEELVKIKQFKLHLVELAERDSGSVACTSMIETTTLFSTISVPSELREEERALARQLLAAGHFKIEPGSQPASNAQIPGEIFTAAMQASGVDRKIAEDAAVGEGSESDRCRFRKALIAEVLRRPGTASRELLQIL